MKRFQQLLAIVHLNDADDAILQATHRVAELSGSSSLVLLHFFEPIDIPEDVIKKYPWLGKPLAQEAEKKLQEYKEAFQKIEGLQVETILMESPKGFVSLLEYISEQSFDLIITDRGGPSGDIYLRLARKALCSVMGVPSSWEGEISRVVVPSDFSPHSARAMDVGLAFAKAGDLGSIECVHVYDIGFGSHRAAIPAEQVAEMTKEHARGKMSGFLREIPSQGVDVQEHFIQSPSVARGLFEHMQNRRNDLIVLGTRGRDTVSSWLMGSNAEDILRTSSVPVIAVKEKGAGQSLLEAFLENA